MTPAMMERIKAHAKDHAMPGTIARQSVEGMPLHIDGDYAAYYCAGNDETSEATARQNLRDRIQRGLEVTGATRAIIHLSDPMTTKGMRYFIAQSKPYQAQRSGSGKPKNWAYLREYMSLYEGDLFTMKNWTDREADDGMAYVAEQSYIVGRPGAVMTADKDMRMFAGLHLVWKTFELVEVLPGTYDLFRCGKQYGHKWFWMQMIQGDTADNILGLPGCGEVAAQKILAGTTDNQQAYERVINTYRKKMGDKYADHFAEQAALLWMRTDKGAAIDNFLTIPNVGWEADIARAAKRLVDRVNAEASHVRTS
ncbi:exonuclease [Stenotrophomonas phage SB2]|uniref:Exonuclease n=1 Tax=Stenotrophomonas phage SB2 TaxID=3117468 RepID=A0ABZ2GYD6_9CAUD